MFNRTIAGLLAMLHSGLTLKQAVGTPSHRLPVKRKKSNFSVGIEPMPAGRPGDKLRRKAAKGKLGIAVIR